MLYRLFPFLQWMHELRNPEVVKADLIAGVTVALVLIPQSMAYAQLAGLPEVYGLYISFLPVLIAALWGSSRQLQTGPVAVVSLMTATALATVVGGTAQSNPDLAAQYIPLAMFMALMVGMFQLFLGVFRLGVVVNFLSHPVIVGFTNAAALVIGLSQLSKIFGVNMPGAPSDHFLSVRIWGVLQQLGDTHMVTLMMGIGAFALMWGMRRYVPKMPGVLVAVVITTLLSWIIGFEKMGGKVVGSIPQGLPGFAMPALDLDMVGALFSSVIVISLVGFMEAISIAKAMAAKTQDRIDPNQELIGQGLGNIAGSFFQSYPASGSFSRSAVNLNAGAKTGFSSVITAMLVVVTLLFLTPLLYHLPKATLAAVIMMAVFGLINFSAIKHAWKANQHDGIAAAVTFGATLGFAPHLDQGILVGAGLSIMFYLYRTMSPRVALLGRHQDGTLRDITVYPELPTDKRVVAIRFDGSLYFANVSYFEDAILEAAANNKEAKYILVVGDGINELDASGEEVLRHVIERLSDSGITIAFSGLKRQVLRVMHRTKLFDVIGRDNIYATEDMALEAIYERIWKNRGAAVANENTETENETPLLMPNIFQGKARATQV
ncbi:MAG: sulfate permease [Gammaproteobacteria bacterium]|nr:sulfate permease [Gammaproteobacteria bacterium]MDH5650892.1 sulfate permease [Gammaproteobacteria bacterium]